MQAKGIERRMIGRGGIEVTRLGVGLWAIGGIASNYAWGPVDDRESLRMIDAAVDAGVTLFDNSDSYGLGHSEELQGQAMKGRRDRFVVCTKIGWGGWDSARNCSAYDTVDKVVAGVENNLRRLQTDHIDILLSHINFRDPTMETMVEGFQKLQEQGKIRAYGVSTSDLDYLKAFNADGRCAVLLTDYSVLNRTPEAALLPYCQAEGISVIARGPLAMGILTGKFTAETRFPQNDFRHNWHDKPDEHAIFLQDLAKVERLRPLAQGRTLAQLALQFVLAHPAITAAVPGAKFAAQVQENMGAAYLPPLTAEDWSALDAITPPGGGRAIWPA